MVFIYLRKAYGLNSRDENRKVIKTRGVIENTHKLSRKPTERRKET